MPAFREIEHLTYTAFLYVLNRSVLVFVLAPGMVIIRFQTNLMHTQPLSCFYSFSFSDAKMTAILDQKHYIEELNRHLSGTVTDLQAKMDSLEKTNSKLVEEVRRTLCEHCVIVVNAEFVCTGCVSPD